MDEHIEAERVRPPEEIERRTEPRPREATGPTDVPPDADFVRYWEVSHREGRYRPGAYDNGAVPPRWKEHPAATDRDLYVHDENRQARVEELYRAEGFSRNTLQAINDEYEVGRDKNCGECARAVAATLDGSPRAADGLLDDGEFLYPMETWADRKFTEPTDVKTGLTELETELIRQGPGSHAVVRVEWVTPREYYERQGYSAEQIAAEQSRLGDAMDVPSGAHFFNAANIDGTVRYIDGQTGQMVEGRAGFVVSNVIADGRRLHHVRTDRRTSWT